MHSEQEFKAAILPRGYHIVQHPVITVADVLNGTNGVGIPVSNDTPWYAPLAEDDDPNSTDEFTAWYNAVCAQMSVNPTDTDEDHMNRVFGYMAFQMIALRGYGDETQDALAAIEAVVVGGAAYIRTHGHAPLDAVAFVDSWQYDRGKAL